MDSNKQLRYARSSRPVSRRVIDGVAPPRQSLLRTQTTVNTAGAAAIAQPYATAQPKQRRQFSTPPSGKPGRWERLQLPLILTGGTLAGFMLRAEAFGIAAVAVYGLFALIFRVPSRTTFSLAALSIAAVTCLLLFKPDLQLAGNFTTYTFLLLVTGVITLIIEGRPLKRRKRERLGRAR